MSAKKPVQEPDTAAPDGNKQKFAWIYEVMADTSLQGSTKVVAVGTALKMAGRKGHFKATRKAIASLCGMSQRTVVRAIEELDDRWYWDVSYKSGGANVYTLVTPQVRLEGWLDAEADHRADVREWLAAEKQFVQRWLYEERQFVQRWLDAEKQFAKEWLRAENNAQHAFQTTVFNAIYAHDPDNDFAYQMAQRAWEEHKQGRLTLESALQTLAEKFGSLDDGGAEPENPAIPDDEPRGMDGTGTDRYGTGTDRYGTGTNRYGTRVVPTLARGRATSNAPTSGDDQTHKSFKDSERPIKVFQGSESKPALRRALDARATRGRLEDVGAMAGHASGGCQLCDLDGKFLDRHGSPVELLDDDCNARTVDCQHSMAANLAEIQRIEHESNGYWAVGKTGLPEIDSHYPQFSDLDDEELWFEEEPQ